jgi:hypothetical protein
MHAAMGCELVTGAEQPYLFIVRGVFIIIV